jgi:hypothetical protein
VDKVTHSTPRFLRLAFIGATLCVAVLLFLPGVPALQWAALTLMFVLSLMVFASRGVIGLASGLAYLPDAFLPGLVAWWIGDASTNTAPHGGYGTLFGVLTAAGLIGIALTSLTLWVQRREPAEEPQSRATALA